MYNKKSEYALNKKDKEAIVSRNAAGEYIKLTKEEFASEEEFAYWKEWSDNDYRREYNSEQSYKRLKKKLQKQAENEAAYLSVEQLLLNDLVDEERKALVNKIKSVLTETQFRRLWLYYVERKTEQQIADIEKVGQRRVSISINVAKKKIKKFFQNNY
jgi:DNA-directed RNA polymerase specialized sigma subunit